MKEIWARIRDSEVLLRSAALAYHTLLSIVPVVGLGLWYLKKIGISDHWVGLTRSYILEHLNVTSSDVFLKQFDQLTQKVQGNGWGWVGLLILLYACWSLLGKFSGSLDAILNEVPSGSRFSFLSWRIWMRRLLAMLGLPIALMISLALSQWIRRDSWLHQLFEIPLLGRFIGMPVAWLSVITSVFFVYYFIPRRRTSLQSALKVAAIVAPLLEGLRAGLGIYAHYAVSMHKIYGILSVIPLFMLWIQLSWTVLLTGALWLEPFKVKN